MHLKISLRPNIAKTSTPCFRQVSRVLKSSSVQKVWNPKPTFAFHAKCTLPNVWKRSISDDVQFSTDSAQTTSKNVPDPVVMDLLRNLDINDEIDALEKTFQFIEKENPSLCVEYYDFIMGIFLKRKYFALVVKYYKHMRERKIQPTQQTYRNLMIAFGFAKNLKLVKYYWNLLHPIEFEDFEIYEEAVQAFGDCGQFSISLSLMEDMVQSRLPVRADVFNRLFDAMIKNNLFNMFPGLLARIKQLDIRPNADMLHFFMVIYGKRREYDQVIQMFERIRFEFPGDLQARDYTLLIINTIEAGKDNLALRYYRDFKRTGLPADDKLYAAILPTLIKFGLKEDINEITNHVVSAEGFTMDALTPIMVTLSTEGDIKELEALFKGLKATPKGYNLLLSALGKVGNLEGMLKLFNHIKETAAHCADRFAYTTVVNYLGKAGRLEDAIAMFNESKVVSPNGQDTALWNALLSAAAHAKRYDFMDKCIAQMNAEMVPLDLWTNIIILDSKCERGDIGSVREHIKVMMGSDRNPSIHALNVLLKATAKHRSVSEMLIVFDFMKRRLESVNVVVYHTVIHALMKAGQMSVAESLFQEAEEVCGVDTALYNMMINCLFDCGELDKIQHYIDRMQEHNLPWDKTTVGMLLKIGYRQKNLEFMKNLVADHSHITLDRISLLYLMLAYGREHQVPEMLHYMQELEKNGGLGADDYAFVISTLSRCERHLEAVTLCEQMVSRGLYSLKGLDYAMHSMVSLKRIQDLPQYVKLLEQHNEQPYIPLLNLVITEFSKYEAHVEDLIRTLKLKKKYYSLTDMDYLMGITALLRWRATSPDTLPSVLELFSSITANPRTKPAMQQSLQNHIIKFIKNGQHTEYIQPFFESLKKAGLQPIPEANTLRTLASA